MNWIPLVAALALTPAQSEAIAQQPPVCDGMVLPWKRPGTPKGAWRERSFWDKTTYEVKRGRYSEVLTAYCKASASARYYEFAESQSVGGLNLCWSWNVLEFPAGEDLSQKAGDDRAATVAAVFNKSRLPWSARAIFYVWSSKLPEGTILSSPYASGVKMWVLRKGTQGWCTEKRNLAEDYVKVFGSPPAMLEAVAVFTDSDNTAGRASAVYGPIVLQKQKNPWSRSSRDDSTRR